MPRPRPQAPGTSKNLGWWFVRPPRAEIASARTQMAGSHQASTCRVQGARGFQALGYSHMSKAREQRAEFQRLTATARAIVEAERHEQVAKTARLRATRMAKEVADLLAHSPGKPRAKVMKRKRGNL